MTLIPCPCGAQFAPRNHRGRRPTYCPRCRPKAAPKADTYAVTPVPVDEAGWPLVGEGGPKLWSRSPAVRRGSALSLNRNIGAEHE